MRTSGSETLSAAANSFVGQTEAPLMIAPFIRTMTTSELMAVMTGGFATVAGGVLAAYVGLLKDVFPDIAGHLIAASVMSAPAALVIAKVMWPETEKPEASEEVLPEIENPDVNLIDAAARGAYVGMKLALNVGAMLLAFIALIALTNALLGLPFELYNDWMGLQGAAAVEPLTLQQILGWIFWPFAFLIGVPVAECATVGTLLGEKLVLTEFIAYLHLYESLSEGVAQLSPRTVVIASYALCGFANFGSIGVQLGGIGGIAPERRHDLARLGLRAMFGGMLASLMTAAVAGILI
jgi:CNT family concentrative nucleoside transporter